MNTMKAVVLEKSGSRYTVLGQDGTFRHVHRRLNAEVGEEIQIRLWTESFSGVRIWAGAAALFVLVLTALLSWNLYQAPTAVALLSVDINPSLQFALDSQGQLLKFQTQNEDAKRMLSQLDLKGKPVGEVLKQIVTQAYDQKFLSSEQYWVVIGYSPMTNKTIEQMPKDLNENQIVSWVTEIGKEKGLIPQVAVFSLTSQERELAQKGDLTLGEYALWQTADKAGVVTQPEKLKETSERVRLLENPQVQTRIKTEKNDRQSALLQSSGVLKQHLESIDKSGEKGKEKLLLAWELNPPNNVLSPWIDKSRSKDGDLNKNNYMQKDPNQEKDQGIDQEKEKNNDNAKNEQIEKKDYQIKDLNNANSKVNKSELEDKRQTKYDKIYLPPILTKRNLWPYKFAEFDGDKKQRH